MTNPNPIGRMIGSAGPNAVPKSDSQLEAEYMASLEDPKLYRDESQRLQAERRNMQKGIGYGMLAAARDAQRKEKQAHVDVVQAAFYAAVESVAHPGLRKLIQSLEGEFLQAYDNMEPFEGGREFVQRWSTKLEALANG